MDDAITDITLGALADSVTPSKSTEEEPMSVFSPATCHRIIDRLKGDVDELLEFRDIEASLKTPTDTEKELASLRLSLNDANVLLNDGRDTIIELQKENLYLKQEVQQCKDCSVKLQKEYELKLFRLQQELEHKNLEILGLRKDKSEFDFKTDLLESRHLRKAEELTEALQEARKLGSSESVAKSESDIFALKSQIEDILGTKKTLSEDLAESKLLVKNLQELLAIQTSRAESLSTAFADSLESWKEIHEDVIQFLKNYESWNSETIHLDNLEEDLLVFEELSSLKKIEPCLSLNFDDSQKFDKDDLIIPVKDAILGLGSWCKSLLDQWALDLEENNMAAQEAEAEMKELVSFCDSYKSLLQSRIQEADREKEIVEKCTNTSFAEKNEMDVPSESKQVEVQTNDNIEFETVNNVLILELNNLKLEKNCLNEQVKILNENEQNLKKKTEILEGRIEKLCEENQQLSRDLKGAKESVVEEEKCRNEIVETTAEAVKGFKEELGDRVVNLMINGGHYDEGEVLDLESSKMSAAEEPSQTELKVVIDTVYTLPRDDSDPLENFAKGFADYLVDNQIFHPEDQPPRDSNVFNFLLDRYLLLIDTFHKARTDLQTNINDLEQQHALSNMKAEALLSQLSQLEVSDSTLCNSSVTDGSMDLLNVQSSTVYEPLSDATMFVSMIADVTQDPLELTENIIASTPRTPRLNTITQKSTPRTSQTSSRIPLGVSSTHALHMNIRTPKRVESDEVIPVTSCFQEPVTPLQRISHRDLSSTAKKSVTFRSPLLVRTAVENENNRLRTVLDERLASVEAMERTLESRLALVRDLEHRVAELEKLAEDTRHSWEQAEAEFLQKREILEGEVSEVRSQLCDLNKKLVVEAINLDPSLEDRLRLIPPCQVLEILLETIIARCQKAQEDDKKRFDKARCDWSDELLEVSSSNQALQEQVRQLNNQITELETTLQSRKEEQEDKIRALEEDALRLTVENCELERSNVKLVKEYDNKLKTLIAKEGQICAIEQEIEEFRRKFKILKDNVTEIIVEKNKDDVESLKLALENSTKEKEILKSRVESMEMLQKSVELVKKGLETQMEFLQNQLSGVLTEKNFFEEEVNLVRKVINDVVEKYFCEDNIPSELSSRLKVIREFVTKRFIERDEENENLQSLLVELRTEMSQMVEDKNNVDVQLKNTQLKFDDLVKKTADLEEEKIGLETTFEALQVLVNGATEEVMKIKEALADKEKVLLNKEVELETLKRRNEELLATIVTLEEEKFKVEKESHVEVKEVVERLVKESCEVERVCEEKEKELSEKLEAETLLKEQVLMVESKEKEIETLKEEHSKVVSDLLTKMSNYVSDLDVEVGKRKETVEVIKQLKNEVSVLRNALSLAQVEEERRCKELETVLAEKSYVEATVASVEEKLKEAEDRLTFVESRNKEFESELLILREELYMNKNLIEQLNLELDALAAAKNELNAEKNKEIEKLIVSKDVFKNEKDVLAVQLEEAFDSRDSLKSEKEALVADLKRATDSRDRFITENNLLEAKLKAAVNHNAQLEETVEQYKSTEAAILRKLEEKQKSDEAAFRLRSELAELEQKLAESAAINSEIDNLKAALKKKSELVKTAEFELITCNNEVRKLEEIVRNLFNEKDNLSGDLEKKVLALGQQERSLGELTNFVKDLESKIFQKEEESQQVTQLLSQRAQTIDDLTSRMDQLSINNGELRELLQEVTKTLGLPEEAFVNLSADSDTKSYLRIFRENVEQAAQERDGLHRQNIAMLSEQQRLTVEVEKLTNDKIHFEIKAAELDALGRGQEEQILALSTKLAQLETGMSRRSKRSDTIGPRRLEKLEDMNKTLHELLTQLITTMQLPNAAKLRLISQREIDAASRQILNHAAKLAAAQEEVENLKEQIKTLDKENEDLSDNVEALLKDNAQLELKLLDNPSSSAHCSACPELRKTLKEKTEEFSRMEAVVEELKDRMKELDEENEGLSENVEALLKDNSKLELQLLEMQNGTLPPKECVSCKSLKNKIHSREDELLDLRTRCEENGKEISSLETNVKELKNKCESLEVALTEKEQQLYRALNSFQRDDEVRACGVGSGLVKQIDQGEKIRSLSKDNTTLKELLRQRAQTIKKLESRLKDIRCVDDGHPILNTNSMNSPIRERNYNLRTRTDVAPKFKIRPKVDGVENLRISENH